MTNKPTALVLGGTNPHLELINNLKKRGYFTILVDYYDDPPAKVAADKHIKESTLDNDKVLAIAKEYNAKLVISTCIDQANATACFVAEKLNLPKPYSYETALNVTVKGLMKKVMLENSIPTSKYVVLKSYDDFIVCDMKFPVVVKPADSNGSVGVRKADNNEQLKEYLLKAIEVSRTNRAIAEEFVDGIEVSIDCFVRNKKSHVILIRQKLELVKEKGNVLQSPGSFSPASISDTAYKNIEQIADIIPKAFNFDNTPLLIQAFVKGDNISIIEFAPRIGGGLSFRTIKLNTGFDILDYTIDYYLGNYVEFSYSKPQYIIATIIIYAKAGILDRIEGNKDLLNKGIIDEFYHYKTNGMQIGSDMSTRSRVGAFIVKANSKEELNNKITESIKQLRVYDINGIEIMRKDIYKSLDNQNSLVI